MRREGAGRPIGNHKTQIYELILVVFFFIRYYKKARSFAVRVDGARSRACKQMIVNHDSDKPMAHSDVVENMFIITRSRNRLEIQTSRRRVVDVIISMFLWYYKRHQAFDRREVHFHRMLRCVYMRVRSTVCLPVSVPLSQTLSPRNVPRAIDNACIAWPSQFVHEMIRQQAWCQTWNVTP